MSDLEDIYQPPHTPPPVLPPTKGSCLQLGLIWGLPLLVVPLIFLVCNAVLPLAIVLSLFFLSLMGNSHANHSRRKTSSGSVEETKPSWVPVLGYVLIQIVWIPLFWITVGWAVCSISGTGGIGR